MKRYARFFACFVLLNFSLAPFNLRAPGADVTPQQSTQGPQDVLKYISSGWDVLTRSMTNCETVSDPKTGEKSVVYLPAGFAVPAAAQDRPTVEQKRGAYVVKYAAAKDLAGILAKHFKGAAEIQAGPEGTSNCLLINAQPAVFDEVMKTLEQLDRRPHSVAVEVFVIELPMKKADDKGNRPDERDFSGTIDDVAGPPAFAACRPSARDRSAHPPYCSAHRR